MYSNQRMFPATLSAQTGPARPNSRTDLHPLSALLVLALILLTLDACGGGPLAPGPPDPPPPPVLVRVFVTPDSVPFMDVGASVQLRAQGQYSDSSLKDLTSSATWSTSDPAIAMVAQGTVTGTGIGTATISAISGSKSGTITVAVGLTHHITISPPGPFSLSATPNISFVATENFSDGTTLDVSGPAFWTASSGGVVNIYPYAGGDATLIGTGTTTVTATLQNGESGSETITVVP